MKKYYFSVLALSALLTGCLPMTESGLQSAIYPPPGGFSSIESPYAAVLGQEYRIIADLFNANGQKDLAIAFNSKAETAQNGQWVYPDSPPDTAKDQIQAYDDLNGALLFIMNKENAPWLAKAQVNYDCWVNLPSEDGCHRNFDRAMHSLLLSEGGARKDVVYFETDSSEITSDTRQKLQTLASQVRMNRNIAIKLVGHSNGGAKNQSLALRRAIALRNTITQMGVSPSRIIVDNESHTDTMLSLQKSEKGGDALNRRVDILMEPMFVQDVR